MSARKPIPQALRSKFNTHMQAHDIDDLPEGAWFQRLEDAADSFMKQHKLNKPWMHPNDATHQYLRSKP